MTAYETYTVQEDVNGGLVSTGPLGQTILTLPGGINRPAADIVPIRPFVQMQRGVAVSVENYSEHTVIFPEANIYCPAYTTGFRATFPQELLICHVQLRADLFTWKVPPGGETIIIRYQDEPQPFSPGLANLNLAAAVMVGPSGYAISDTFAPTGVAMWATGGYDTKNPDFSGYSPARTPNVVLQGTTILGAMGNGFPLATYTAPAGQYWRVLAAQFGTRQSSTASLPIWWLNESGAPGNLTPQQGFGMGAYLTTGLLRFPGAGIKAGGAASTLTAYGQDNGAANTPMTYAVYLYVGP